MVIIIVILVASSSWCSPGVCKLNQPLVCKAHSFKSIGGLYSICPFALFPIIVAPSLLPWNSVCLGSVTWRAWSAFSLVNLSHSLRNNELFLCTSWLLLTKSLSAPSAWHGWPCTIECVHGQYITKMSSVL